jgi:LmbE family N-acetylglucosaminyl deacetylase
MNPGQNPYLRLVAEQARLLEEGRSLPRGGMKPATLPALAKHAPRVLMFAPHPDDECLVGGLALRLLRQAGMRVIDVAVTLGSNPARQEPRLLELRGACAYLGFEVVTTAARGLERINARARADDPGHWVGCVEVIAGILGRHRPAVVFFPHVDDRNSTHIGTHLLLVDALAHLGPAWSCIVVETEYWAAMNAPNLMVESSVQDVAELVAGVSFHAGEVERNPYHLLMPAWMQDNVRRGTEIVGAQGGTAPRFGFATLYGVRRWIGGRLEAAYSGGRLLAASDDPARFFSSLF